MSTWLVWLWDTYWTWWEYHFMQSQSPGYYDWSLIISVALLGGIFGGIASYREKRYFTDGFVGSLCGIFIGFLCGFVFDIDAPLFVGLLAILTIVASVVGVFVAIDKHGKKLFDDAVRFAGRIKHACQNSIGKLRSRSMFRRQPTDYLLQLDKSAVLVDERLQDLLTRRDALGEHLNAMHQRIVQANHQCGLANPHTVAKEIASNVLETFQKQQADIRHCLDELNETVATVQNGKKEMANLIALARLCRQAGQPLQTDTSRATQAAHAALVALIDSFAQADAALSKAAIEMPEIDAELAIRPLKEGMDRNVRLRLAAEGFTDESYRAPLRVKC